MGIANNEIKISDNVLKKLEIIAKASNKTENQILEDIVNKEAEKIENKHIHDKIERISKGKIRVLNKNTYNPNSEEFKKMVGIIKAPPDFDPVKACREVKEGKY